MIDKVPYWMTTKCKLSKRGIPPKHTKIETKQKESIISDYKTGEFSFSSLGDKYNRNTSSIARLLNKNGFKAKSASDLAKKYEINENYFNSIDTEGKAYLLGFLYADGSNCVSNYEIIVSLQERDISILENFKKEMNSTHPIKIYNAETNGVSRRYCRLSIGNKKISTDLERHGCMQTKSFKIKKPDSVPYNLIHHFFRGYFDGDGSFAVNKALKSNMIFTITSNKIFLEQLQDILIEKLSVNKTKISTASNSNECIGVLVYGGRGNCIKIRDWMYNNATIFLERKKDKLYSI